MAINRSNLFRGKKGAVEHPAPPPVDVEPSQPVVVLEPTAAAVQPLPAAAVSSESKPVAPKKKIAPEIVPVAVVPVRSRRG